MTINPCILVADQPFSEFLVSFVQEFHEVSINICGMAKRGTGRVGGTGNCCIGPVMTINPCIFVPDQSISDFLVSLVQEFHEVSINICGMTKLGTARVGGTGNCCDGPFLTNKPRILVPDQSFSDFLVSLVQEFHEVSINICGMTKLGTARTGAHILSQYSLSRNKVRLSRSIKQCKASYVKNFSRN